MIYLYSGTPGSGKSLHQARIIKNRLQYGRPVIANFDFAVEKIKRCKGEFIVKYNDELTPEFLIRYSRHYFKEQGHKFKEGELWVLIDEAQLLFNAREWSAVGRAAWMKFFTQHRKYGYDVFLIAQFDRMLDRQLRSLIEYEYVHRKVSNFGIWGKIFNALAGGGLFVCVKVWYPMKERVGAEWFKYRRKYADLYDSYKDFDMVEDAQVAQASERPSQLTAPALDDIIKEVKAL